MDVVVSSVVAVILSYLVGSIPSAYIVGRMAKGIDIRKTGSGNIGATNAMRVLGKPAGIFVLLVDAAKGFAACFFAAAYRSTGRLWPSGERRNRK